MQVRCELRPRVLGIRALESPDQRRRPRVRALGPRVRALESPNDEAVSGFGSSSALCTPESPEVAAPRSVGGWRACDAPAACRSAPPGVDRVSVSGATTQGSARIPPASRATTQGAARSPTLTRSEPGSPTLTRQPDAHPRNAVNSISTCMRGSIRAGTSTIVATGRMSRKISPWARPTSSEREMSVT